ncbi:ABC transporter ATP-binding protein, partial [Bacillus cereus]|nr:ABC transporter ATP-binding protein [Bacillus cereus]
AMRRRAMGLDKTLSFSMEEMNNFSTASLITRSPNEGTQIQTVVALGLQVIIKAPILAVWAIVKIADKNWQWTASTGAAVAALILMLSA